MSVCTSCQQEMHTQVGCVLAVFNDFRDQQPRRRIMFGSEEMSAGAKWEHCPDCLAPIGTFHHPGCDIEQCPCCNKQAISCSCVVQFRPSAEALETALAEYHLDHGRPGETEAIAFTDVYVLDKDKVTSIFHWPEGSDPLGWWFFAEEREVSQEILRVAPISTIFERDPDLVRMLELPEGKKAFREEDSDDWEIHDID